MTVRTPRARPPLAWHEGASRYFIAGLVLLGLLVVGSQIIAGNGAALKERGACEKACTNTANNCKDGCQGIKSADRGVCEKWCEVDRKRCNIVCNAPLCTDSDGGMSIATRGTCTDSSGAAGGVAYTWNAGTSSWDVSYVSSLDDTCGYENGVSGYLLEAYCSEYPIAKGYCTTASIKCPFGCADGACIIPDELK